MISAEGLLTLEITDLHWSWRLTRSWNWCNRRRSCTLTQRSTVQSDLLDQLFNCFADFAFPVIQCVRVYVAEDDRTVRKSTPESTAVRDLGTYLTQLQSLQCVRGGVSGWISTLYTSIPTLHGGRIDVVLVPLCASHKNLAKHKLCLHGHVTLALIVWAAKQQDSTSLWRRRSWSATGQA